jgi:uncharacterized protein YhfF
MTVPPEYKGLSAYPFGDGPQLSDELLALVLEGKKTATCGALWQYAAEKWPLPEVGGRWIVLDGRGKPRCVVETTESSVKRFDEVDEKFAYDEGEDDRTYASWRHAHENYFTRQGKFSPDMLVVCERFKLIATFAAQEAVS